MKNKKIGIFAIIFVVIFCLFSLFLVRLYDFFVYSSLNQMVYRLETVYPDAEILLIEALLQESDETDVLNKYGIDVNTVREIPIYMDFRAILLVLIFFAFLLFFVLFFLMNYFSNKKVKREIHIINQYLQDILNDHYELDIALYDENELSVLKNDIYKVTIKLKELSNYEQREQQFLMKTLEDIAHQLKTPLTALMLTNDILANNDLTEEERSNFLRKESKELEKMEWLITTLLKLSKLDSGQVKFKKEKIKAEDLIDEALESLLIPLELKDITIQKKHLDFTLFCDEAWMREALTNVLKNAYEHVLEHGKIMIRGEDNPVYKSISITDNGPGIKKQEIKNIFRRFYSTNSSKNSMGIGLNMARIIVEQHNGKIEVESEIGKYTTFKIIFMKRNC